MCGMGCQLLSKSVDYGAAVNYLLKYCLYCVSTEVLLMCMKGLQFGSLCIVSGNFPLIVEGITDLVLGDKYFST